MVEWALAEAATVTKGQVIGDPATRWSGAAIDSRAIRGRELFVALPGQNADGHDFAAIALERGAAAALVSRQLEGVRPILVVPEVLPALHELTRAVRLRTPERLVAVTGSAGKSTTKEILAHLLATRFRVARSPGNLNNLIGFPLALLGIDEGVEWMVAEMGMSTPGELGGVSRLGRPDVCVFTNVGSAHLGGLGSRAALIDAKAELLEGLASDGLVVANADDAGARAVAQRHHGRTVWFGSSHEFRIEAFQPRPEILGSNFRLVTPGGQAEIQLPLLGLHNATNFLAAATTAITLGVSLDLCAAAAATLGPLAGRGVASQLPTGAWLIDESYNANPEATKAALAAAAGLPGSRRFAVLGAMLELGDESEQLHREVGAAAAALGFEVLAVGEEARELARAASGEWVANAAAAVAQLCDRRFGQGDVVLIKGSRGVRLEAVVQAIREGHG